MRASFPNRSELERHQLGRLQSLVSTLLESNPYYSSVLRAADVHEPPQSLSDYTQQVPFTLKESLVDDQSKHPPYGTNLTYPVERYTRFNQTSGTTGKPMRWLDTPEDWDWMLDCWTGVYEAAGMHAADRVFFPFSFGPFLGFWVAFEAAIRMGCLAIPGGGMRSPARVKAILDNEVTILCSTPTYAVHLANVAAAENVDLASSKLRAIIVAGEPGGSIPATRTLIERLWPGTRVFDHHGMTEIGPVTYECPERRGVLHVMEAAYFAEVVDPDRPSPVSPGEKGELVLTNLGRLGSPILRYRTGDIVQPLRNGRCTCGSYELALEGGILGRTDDMLVVRGVNLFPSAVEDVLRSCEGLVEFQVETSTNRALPEMSIRVEAAPGVADPGWVADRVAEAIHTSFGLRVNVSPVPSGSLPRYEAKAKRWKRL
jgi:phenylacetate-CoA ligase